MDARAPKTKRRLVMVALLCIAALTLAGLTFSETLERAPETIGRSLQEAVGRSWQGLVTLARGPARVGIQIGHEDAAAHPDELAALRVSTGGYWRGVSEVEINRAVAAELERLLSAKGIAVDILPATVPPHYHADLFVSLHADSHPDPERRGYKSAHFDPPRNALEPLLKAHLDAAYFAASRLPDDHHNVSPSMRYYYAFNVRRFHHAVHPGTPAVIVEMGYLSHPSDLAFLQEPRRPAEALAEGIVNYLRERGRVK